LAEAALTGIMVDPHDKGIFPARDIVGAGETIAGQNLVQFQQGIDVAGVQTDDRSGLHTIFDLSVPGSVQKRAGGEVLPVGQKIGLGRILGGLIIEIDLVECLNRQILVERLASVIDTDLLGRDHLSLSK